MFVPNHFSLHPNKYFDEDRFIIPYSFKSEKSLPPIPPISPSSLISEPKPFVNKRHCHICRSPKEITKIVSCASGKRSHIFCSSCIERRLQSTFMDVINDPKWICPKCQDSCPCSKCKKKKDPDQQHQKDQQKVNSQQKVQKNSSTSEDTDAALTLLTIKHSPIISWTHSSSSSSSLTSLSTSGSSSDSPSPAFSRLAINSSPTLHSSSSLSPLSPFSNSNKLPSFDQVTQESNSFINSFPTKNSEFLSFNHHSMNRYPSEFERLQSFRSELLPLSLPPPTTFPSTDHSLLQTKHQQEKQFYQSQFNQYSFQQFQPFTCEFNQIRDPLV